MLLLLALVAQSGPATAAEEAPRGSYLASCENVWVDVANVLHATCRRVWPTPIDTALQLPCAGSIDNIGGYLVCTPAPPGGAPAGTYTMTCENIRVEAAVLRAKCQSGWQGPRETFLNLPCNGSVGNGGGYLQCTPFPSVPVDARELVTKFAPILKFTSGADGYGYPMSADTFWSALLAGRENTDPATLATGTVPTYFSYRRFGGQVRITYWWFYGRQHPCSILDPGHDGDWESVLVILREDLGGVAAVRYSQHDGSYLRISGPRAAPCTPAGTGRCAGASGFPTESGRPIVYVGRIAHGSYHDTYGGIEGDGNCFYFLDKRNGDGPQLDTSRKLVDLDGSGEAWLAADRIGGFRWGAPGAVNTHPTQQPATQWMAACEGTPLAAPISAGCYMSEALAGDDQASQNALKECKPGYDNAGLTCNKGVLPWEWQIYGRLNPGNYYEYNYTIPTGDAGLARRRSGEYEWNLP